VNALSRRGLGGILLLLAAAATVRAETPEELFERGNAAYESARYDDAAVAYETVLKYGIRDPRVEYNLGNAYFRVGNLGRAILHYERAHRLSPVDPDIFANLELARSRRFDRVEAEEVSAVVRWTRAAQDRLGPDRQALVFLVLIWLIAGLVTWATIRPSGWTAAVGWTLAALALATSLTALSWLVTWQRLEGERIAVVLDDSVEVLAGPGENNAALFTVHEGLTLTVRSERPGWVQVSLPNGLNGWVPRAVLGFV
jgi:tetratricopeptide (TPR) repeat protein